MLCFASSTALTYRLPMSNRRHRKSVQNRITILFEAGEWWMCSDAIITSNFVSIFVEIEANTCPIARYFHIKSWKQNTNETWNVISSLRTVNANGSTFDCSECVSEQQWHVYSVHRIHRITERILTTFIGWIVQMCNRGRAKTELGKMKTANCFWNHA